MVDVRQAAQAALSYVMELLGAETVLDPRIEEVELSPDEQFWDITVGFSPPQRLGNYPVRQPGGKREYKQLKIQASDGVVRSMKIRAI